MWPKSRIIRQPSSKKTPAAILSHHLAHDDSHSHVASPSSCVVHHDRLDKISRRRDRGCDQPGNHRRTKVELQAGFEAGVFHQCDFGVVVCGELSGTEEG